MKCRNCETELNGNYCHACGQSANIRQINLLFVLHQLRDGIFQVDRGFFYTAKELFLRPALTLDNYLTGKRIRYFKPVSYVMILGTVFALLNHWLQLDDISDTKLVTDSIKTAYADAQEWINTRYTLFSFLLIPFFALSFYLFFRKEKYNFFEHLVINTYLIGQQFLIHIILIPVIWIGGVIAGFNLVGLFMFIYTVWVYQQLFSNKSLVIRLIKSVCAYIIGFLMVTVFLVLIYIIFRNLS